MEIAVENRLNIHNVYHKYGMPINPYIFDTGLKYEAFIAPLDFDPDAQELNIIKVFDQYDDVNKKYIFSVGNSTETVLPAINGRSYAYKQDDDAYIIIESGTIIWNVGSAKRHVIAIDLNSTVSVVIPNSSVWFFCNKHIEYLLGSAATTLKYIHVESDSSISVINDAFRDNVNLIGLVNLNKLNRYSNACFYNCKNIIDILFNPSIYLIPDEMFRSCSYITNIDIPELVTSIGAFSFQRCWSSTIINIPKSIQYIGTSAFLECHNAIFNSNNIEFDSLSVLGNGVFPYCSKIKTIDFTGSSFTRLGIDGSEGLGMFEGCSQLESAILPSTLTEIDVYSFRRCPNLKYITIPESVVNINYGAFFGCYSLSFINNYNPVPQNITSFSYTFGDISKSIPLHVRSGSVSAYQSAAGWSEFTNIIGDL